MTSLSTSADPRPRPVAASACVTYGAALTFETVGILDADQSLLRLRPLEDTLLRVIAGVVHLAADGEERVLEAGDEAIVAAGTAYRLAGVGGEARFVSGFRRR
jgi:uncharacterized cupin superfamily protein